MPTYLLARKVAQLYLQGTQRSAALKATVEVFLRIVSHEIVQYDKRLERRDPNPNRLGIFMKGLERLEDDMAGIKDRDDAEALETLKEALRRKFHVPFVERVVKQIDAWLTQGKLPSLKG